MNTDGGALHFDSDIDNRKFLVKVAQMEDRIEVYANNVINANKAADDSFKRLFSGLNDGAFKSGIKGMQTSAGDLQQTVTTANKAIEDSYSRLGQNISSGKFKAGIDQTRIDFASLGRAAVNGNNAAAASFNSLGSSAIENGNKIAGVFSGLTGVITGFLSIQAAKGFVEEVIKIRSEFEGLDVAFTTILKSKERADALMSEVIDFAATTPFGLTEVAKTTKQLLAYGVAAEDVKDELTTLGDIAAGVSQPIGEIAYLYGTLKTQGRAYAADIRQFTGRGIPIIAELAKQFKVTSAEVAVLVEEGKVGFPEVQKAFQNMSGAGGAFFDLMDKQSRTTAGQIANLQDKIDVMFNSFGEANSGVINAGIAGAALLVENYKTVVDGLAILIATYGTYRAALILTAIAQKNLTVTETIAQGYKMVQVTRAMTAAEALRAIGLGISTKAQLIYNAAVLAMPMTAAIAAVVGFGLALYSLSQANNTANEAAERFNSISTESEARRKREADKVEEYVKIAKDATSTDEQRARAIKKLNDLNPEFLGGLNSANIATKEGSDAIQRYLDDLNNKALGELAYAEKQANLRKIIELQSKNGIDSLSNGERTGQGLKNFLMPTSQGIGAGDWVSELFDGEKATKRIVDQKVKALQDANKLIDSKYKTQITDFQLKGVTDDVDVTKSTKRTEAFVKAEIKALEDKRSAEAISSKAYRDYTNQIKALNDELANAQGKLTKEQKKDQSERLSALKAIEQAEIKSKQRNMTDSAEKVQRAKDEATKLREQAKKAGLGPGAIKRIDNVERTNTGNIEYENETDRLSKELDRQKDLYEKYEEYKTTVSVKAANERYQQELSEFATYGDYLQSAIDKLYEKAGSPTGLTGPEQDRLNMMLERQKKFNTDSRSLEAKRYADVFNATATANQKILQIEAQYQLDLKDLGENADKEQAANLLKTRNEKIDAARDEAFKKTEIYRKLNQDIIEMSKNEAKIQIATIEGILTTAKGISPEMRQILAEQLEYAKKVVSGGTKSAFVDGLKEQKAGIENVIATQKLSNEQLAEYKRQLDEINGKLKEQTSAGKFAADLAEGFSQVGSAVSELGSALEDSNPELAYALGSLGDIAKIGADAAGAFASFSSGDIIGGVTKTLGAIGGIFSLGSKVKKMNAEARAEMQKYYDNVQSGEIAYQALLRDRERKLLEINAIGLKGINDQTNALKAQQDQINKDFENTLKQLQGDEKGEVTGSTYKHGTLFRKAKTTYQYGSLAGKSYEELERLYNTNVLTDGAKKLFEELQKLREEGADVEAALLDAGKAAAELATGTTVENLSANIINNLRAGTTGLQNVMDDYTSIIQDALLSTFKSDVVDVEMKAFYERLSALSQSGGELTDEEIKQAQDDYIATRERIQKAFEDREKITGVSLRDSTASAPNGITAEVKSITQDTAVAIEGLMRGIYEISKANGELASQNSVNLSRQTELIGQGVALQVEIRDNTAAISKNTGDQLAKTDSMIQELKTIVTNTIPAKTARDLGQGGL